MRPVILVILDGWGYSKDKIGNAVRTARTPNFDNVLLNYPSLLLQASGKAVGMRWGESGNSEVGHLTIGAGRVVFQAFSRINKSVEDGSFFNNQVLSSAAEHAINNNSKFHIAGLLTSGSVHAYFDHLLALVEFASQRKINNVYLHLFTDGKDSDPKEGKLLLKRLQEKLKDYENIKIGTIIGRDFAMDRNGNWDLTEQAYNLMVNGKGQETDNPLLKIEECYKSGVSDPKISPLIINKESIVRSGDALVFFNFREDSMRQITKPFIEDDFNLFERQKLDNINVTAMTQYLENKNLNIVFTTPETKNSLGEVISINNKRQLHIAETEKYAHVTYFFNCLKNNPYPGEIDILIESNKDNSINPEMKAIDIYEKFSSEFKKDLYEFILINFANADILAHSGNLEATMKGVEVVDQIMGKIKDEVMNKNAILIITADHGNAERMVHKAYGEMETKHNLNPVTFTVIAKEYEGKGGRKSFDDVGGLLSDIAPTILELMELNIPDEMIGQSLLKILNNNSSSD